MPKHSKKPARAPLTKMEFVGAQMSNFLYNLTHNSGVSEDDRARAKKLCDRWDSISNSGYRINNPIVVAELEEQFFPGGK
jgi:hypothetical protein